MQLVSAMLPRKNSCLFNPHAEIMRREAARRALCVAESPAADVLLSWLKNFGLG
jgi:hypothetical protein